MLFCQARSGSTTLMYVLNLHSQIKCAFEPFSVEAGHSQPVADVNALKQALAKLWLEYSGIKHVATPDGWPFEDGTLNWALLDERDCDFVFLTRRNGLRRLVSSELARQTNIYHFWTSQQRDKFRSFRFEPLDIARIAADLEKDRRFVDECRLRLRARRAHYCELEYESILGPQAKFQDQLRTINQLLNFLGCAPFDEASQPDELARLLSSGAGTTASDSPEVYHEVPNIDEVEKTLGSDQNGWLFK
jgi:hypothetical protein